MTSDDLTREQVEATEAVVLRYLRWHNALRDRMDRTGWPPTDELRQAAERAWQAVYAMRVELHYSNCRDVTGGATTLHKPARVSRR